MLAVLVAGVVVAGIAVGSAVVELVHRNSHETPGPPLRRTVPGSSFPVLWYSGARSVDPKRARRELLVELVTAVLLGATAYRIGFDWSLPSFLLLTAALVALSVVDLNEFRLPDRINFPTAGINIVLLGLASAIKGDIDPWKTGLLGGLSAFGFFFVFNLISPQGLAFGDVKLAGVMGINLGWLSFQHVIAGLFLGSLFGAVGGIIILKIRGQSTKAHYPYGPFLAAGGLAAILIGNALVSGGSTV